MGELAWLGSRLTAADVQAINAADARGGLEAVRQMLAPAGLTDAGFAALEAQYGRGGLQAVGVAVQAQIQHEAQEAAAQEATAVLERLGPEDWHAAAQLLAADPSGQRLAERAAQLGVSPQAALAAVRHLATHGVDATRQAVTEHVQARTRADAAHAAAERDFEAAQADAKWNPLAKQEIHQAALNFYSAHAAALEAAGVGARSGESPVAWLRRMANAGDAVAPKVAQAAGMAPEKLARIFSETLAREAEHEVVSRLRASDEAQRKARTIKPQHPEGDKRPTRNEDQKIREAMERAAEKTGFHEEDRRFPANDKLQIEIAAADEYLSGKEPGSTFYPAGSHGRKAARELSDGITRSREPKGGISGAMERAAAYLEGREVPEPAPSTSTRGDDSQGMTIDQAMRAADRHLNGGNTDDE